MSQEAPARQGTGAQVNRDEVRAICSTADAAHGLHKLSLHVFPLDHPEQPKCIGRHGKDTPCDGQRGKHPAVQWKTWAIAPTAQMIDQQWARHGGAANIGISCGPSNLVVLDEDAPGEIERWCVTHSVTLPDTYTVTTGRGRHLYFGWDHTTKRIGNVPKATGGFKLDVRGDGGYVVAEGSTHSSGAVYAGNGAPIAELPEQVAEILLAADTRQPDPEPAWEDVGRGGDPNTTKIGYGHRHDALVSYAGRLRRLGLDYPEGEVLFRTQWLLCEQPSGQIPEARFHSPGCPTPVTWEEAKVKLRDVFRRYPAGKAIDCHAAPEGVPRLRRANELKTAEQPRWLAKDRLPFAAITLLVGDEGIGKSLLWVWIAAAVTTGKPLPEFGIPARQPGQVILVCTEDDWATVVSPRLTVAGADLAMIRVICTEDDGSGSPVFPRDLTLITDADPKPALVVVDCWLDTVPATLSVKDPQQARLALHPWKEAATVTDANMLLLCHTNRVVTPNARERYGVTMELRKKARMTLYAQASDDGALIVGPEKSNGAAIANATKFAITPVQHFAPTDDHDGTVPRLDYAGDSDRTAREHLADAYAATHDAGDAVGWLATYLAPGPRWAADAHQACEEAGFSEKAVKTAKRKLNVQSHRDTATGPWFWRLPQDKGAPESRPQVPGGLSRDAWTSGTSGPSGVLAETFQKSLFTSQDSLNAFGDTQGHVGDVGDTPDRRSNGAPSKKCACGNSLSTAEAVASSKCRPCRDRIK